MSLTDHVKPQFANQTKIPDMLKWPKLSIITPSYNQSQYLEETIRSVLFQGYPNLEYIIIDGGSTDGSVEIIKKYEPWLAYWISEPDQGQSNAINKGFQRSTGTIFAWINSDDVYKPGTFFKVAEVFQKHPDSTVFFGDCDVIDEYSRIVTTIRGNQFDPKELLLVTNKHHNITQPSSFFSSSAVRQVGGLNESLHMIMDIDIYLRLASQFGTDTFHYVPETWSCFRRHSLQKTYYINPIFQKERLTVIENLYHQSAKTGIFNDPSIQRKALAWAYWVYSYGLLKQGHLMQGIFNLIKAVIFDVKIITRPRFRSQFRDIIMHLR